MRTVEQAVVEALERRSEKRPVLLCDRLDEDLLLDGMEAAAVALQLQTDLGRQLSADDYRRVFTVSDFVKLFEAAARSR